MINIFIGSAYHIYVLIVTLSCLVSFSTSRWLEDIELIPNLDECVLVVCWLRNSIKKTTTSSNRRCESWVAGSMIYLRKVTFWRTQMMLLSCLKISKRRRFLSKLNHSMSFDTTSSLPEGSTGKRRRFKRKSLNKCVDPFAATFCLLQCLESGKSRRLCENPQHKTLIWHLTTMVRRLPTSAIAVIMVDRANDCVCIIQLILEIRLRTSLTSQHLLNKYELHACNTSLLANDRISKFTFQKRVCRFVHILVSTLVSTPRDFDGCHQQQMRQLSEERLYRSPLYTIHNFDSVRSKQNPFSSGIDSIKRNDEITKARKDITQAGWINHDLQQHFCVQHRWYPAQCSLEIVSTDIHTECEWSYRYNMIDHDACRDWNWWSLSSLIYCLRT